MATYKPKDSFYHKAKRDRFAARSVYKLDEIDRRFSLLSKNDRVLDLGCAPGSWLQYTAEIVGPGGFVLGYDIVPVAVSPGSWVHTLVRDVHELRPEDVRADTLQALGKEGESQGGGRELRFDAVLSDMAPKTTGIRDADQARSIGMVDSAMDLALSLLTHEGVLVAKVFQGRGFDELVKRAREAFFEVRVLKPEATRKGSRECFLIARKKKPTGEPES